MVSPLYSNVLVYNDIAKVRASWPVVCTSTDDVDYTVSVSVGGGVFGSRSLRLREISIPQPRPSGKGVRSSKCVSLVSSYADSPIVRTAFADRRFDIHVQAQVVDRHVSILKGSFIIPRNLVRFDDAQCGFEVVVGEEARLEIRYLAPGVISHLSLLCDPSLGPLVGDDMF